jgi:hypothetical protein
MKNVFADYKSSTEVHIYNNLILWQYTKWIFKLWLQSIDNLTILGHTRYAGDKSVILERRIRWQMLRIWFRQFDLELRGPDFLAFLRL